MKWLGNTMGTEKPICSKCGSHHLECSMISRELSSEHILNLKEQLAQTQDRLNKSKDQLTKRLGEIKSSKTKFLNSEKYAKWRAKRKEQHAKIIIEAENDPELNLFMDEDYANQLVAIKLQTAEPELTKYIEKKERAIRAAEDQAKTKFKMIEKKLRRREQHLISEIRESEETESLTILYCIDCGTVHGSTASPSISRFSHITDLIRSVESHLASLADTSNQLRRSSENISNSISELNQLVAKSTNVLLQGITAQVGGLASSQNAASSVQKLTALGVWYSNVFGNQSDSAQQINIDQDIDISQDIDVSQDIDIDMDF